MGLVLQHTTLTNFVLVPVPFHYPLFDPYSFFSILLARDVTTTTAATTSLRLLPTGFSQVAHMHLGPLSLRSQWISRLGLHPALRSCNDLVLQRCLNPNLTTTLSAYLASRRCGCIRDSGGSSVLWLLPVSTHTFPVSWKTDFVPVPESCS